MAASAGWLYSREKPYRRCLAGFQGRPDWRVVIFCLFVCFGVPKRPCFLVHGMRYLRLGHLGGVVSSASGLCVCVYVYIYIICYVVSFVWFGNLVFRGFVPILGAILRIAWKFLWFLSLFFFRLENWLSVVFSPCGAILLHMSNFPSN